MNAQLSEIKGFGKFGYGIHGYSPTKQLEMQDSHTVHT